MGFTGRRHTYRLVVFDIELDRSPGNHLSISRNDVARTDLISQAGDSLIDSHAAGLDQAIGFAPGTDPVLSEKFIDSKLIGHKGSKLFSRLRTNSVSTPYTVGILHAGTDVNMFSGCSKGRPSQPPNPSGHFTLPP
jgi:hypothetical protein